MNTRVITLFLTALLLLLLESCDCGTDPHVHISADTSTATPEQNPYPVVEIKGSRITLDGKPAGKTEQARMTRVEELHDMLRQTRRAFQTANPYREFPGKLVILCAPDTSMLAVKSAYGTSVFAGYRHVSLATHPGFITVESLFPRRADPDRVRAKELHVNILPKEVVFVVKQRTALLAETKLAWESDRYGIAMQAALTNALVEHFKTSELNSDGLPDVVLYVDNALRYRDLVVALRASDEAHRQLGGDNPNKRVFELNFSLCRGRSRHTRPSLRSLYEGYLGNCSIPPR